MQKRIIVWYWQDWMTLRTVITEMGWNLKFEVQGSYTKIFFCDLGSHHLNRQKSFLLDQRMIQAAEMTQCYRKKIQSLNVSAEELLTEGVKSRCDLMRNVFAIVVRPWWPVFEKDNWSQKSCRERLGRWLGEWRANKKTLSSLAEQIEGWESI